MEEFCASQNQRSERAGVPFPQNRERQTRKALIWRVGQPRLSCIFLFFCKHGRTQGGHGVGVWFLPGTQTSRNNWKSW